MGFKSFGEWKAEKAGKVTTDVGVASAAPSSGTPLDTGSNPRPRMTFQEWKAQKQKAPMVADSVTQGVAQAQQPAAQQEPGLMDELGAATSNFINKPIETVAGATAGLLAAPVAAAKQLLPGTDGFMDTVRGAQEFGKGDVAPFIKEEALPTAGALALTALAPELAIPVAVGRYGASLSVLAKSLYYGATGFAGATSGEMMEQVAKKEGFLDAPDGAPGTYGEAAQRAITRGTEEGAWTTAGALLFGMLPVAGRAGFSMFSSAKEGTKNMVEFLEKHDGPILVSDVMDSLAVNLADSAATNSYSKAGQTMRETRQAQRDVVYKEAKKPMIELARTATDDAIELYQDGVLHSLPSSVLADHLRTALVDGEKVARSVIGVRYDAIDKLAGEMGTETITRMGSEIVKDVNTGKPLYDPVFGRVITRPTMEIIEVPKYTVDTTSAKDVIGKLIEERAGALQEDAAVDFTKFAREQINLFKVNNKVTFKEARSIISDMDKEARRLARQDGDEFAATKRKFLLDSMAEFRGAMEVTGKRMADDGHTIGGKTIDTYLQETNGMWKEVSEDFGNKYIQSYIKKADKIEGAADSLAVAFLQNRESAGALMKALETAEKSAAAPEMRLYTLGKAEDVIAAMPKARAAISFKVYENLLQQYMNPGTRAKALAFMNSPESRGTVNQLLGTDLFNQTDIVMKVLHEMESAKIDVGEYTQFARESGAVLSTASGEWKARTVATLAAPGQLAKMLHSPEMLKVARGLQVADTITQKAAIIAQLAKMGGEAIIKDYDNMTPEEHALREYRLKLQ